MESLKEVDAILNVANDFKVDLSGVLSEYALQLRNLPPELLSTYSFASAAIMVEKCAGVYNNRVDEVYNAAIELSLVLNSVLANNDPNEDCLRGTKTLAKKLIKSRRRRTAAGMQVEDFKLHDFSKISTNKPKTTKIVQNSKKICKARVLGLDPIAVFDKNKSKQEHVIYEDRETVIGPKNLFRMNGPFGRGCTVEQCIRDFGTKIGSIGHIIDEENNSSLLISELNCMVGSSDPVGNAADDEKQISHDGPEMKLIPNLECNMEQVGPEEQKPLQSNAPCFKLKKLKVEPDFDEMDIPLSELAIMLWKKKKKKKGLAPPFGENGVFAEEKALAQLEKKLPKIFQSVTPPPENEAASSGLGDTHTEEVLQPTSSNLLFSEVGSPLGGPEDDRDDGVPNYHSSPKDAVNFEDIPERTSSFQRKLLAAGSQRPFDVHQYSSNILCAFKEIGDTLSIGKLFGGLKVEEINRYFVTTLMLANTHNLKLDCSSLQPNTLQVTLLSRQHHDMENFLMPSSTHTRSHQSAPLNFKGPKVSRQEPKVIPESSSIRKNAEKRHLLEDTDDSVDEDLDVRYRKQIPGIGPWKNKSKVSRKR